MYYNYIITQLWTFSAPSPAVQKLIFQLLLVGLDLYVQQKLKKKILPLLMRMLWPIYWGMFSSLRKEVLVTMSFAVDALLPVPGSHHRGSVVKFFVRFWIGMTIGRYIRHCLEISVMLWYQLNLAISGTKVSLFRWTLSYRELKKLFKNVTNFRTKSQFRDI